MGPEQKPLSKSEVNYYWKISVTVACDLGGISNISTFLLSLFL